MENDRPVWRRYPHLFRGAAGLIRRARWWGTSELDPTHRPILYAIIGGKRSPASASQIRRPARGKPTDGSVK